MNQVCKSHSLLSPGLRYRSPVISRFGNLILTHIFLGHLPILLPYKNPELVHAAVRQLAPVVQKVDSAIRWINLYPVNSAIGFSNTYPLDSYLPSG